MTLFHSGWGSLGGAFGRDPFAAVDDMINTFGSQAFAGGPGSQMMKTSFSSSSQTGPDGRPVVVESRRQEFADGRGHRLEQYEVKDGACGKEHFGIARGIGDQHVAVHKTRNAITQEEQSHTHFEGIDEQNLDQFDQQWQQGTSGQPFWSRSQTLGQNLLTDRRSQQQDARQPLLEGQRGSASRPLDVNRDQLRGQDINAQERRAIGGAQLREPSLEQLREQGQQQQQNIGQQPQQQFQQPQQQFQQPQQQFQQPQQQPQFQQQQQRFGADRDELRVLGGGQQLREPSLEQLREQGQNLGRQPQQQQNIGQQGQFAQNFGGQQAQSQRIQPSQRRVLPSSAWGCGRPASHFSHLGHCACF